MMVEVSVHRSDEHGYHVGIEFMVPIEKMCLSVESAEEFVADLQAVINEAKEKKAAAVLKLVN